MRNTKTRRALLDLFDSNSKPVSATEVLDHLAHNKMFVNKTTVYRELSFLRERGIVREVIWDDSVVRYEKHDPECHHHVVCKICGHVEPVQVDERTLFESVAKQSRFKIATHIVEFFGVCPKCA